MTQSILKLSSDPIGYIQILSMAAILLLYAICEIVPKTCDNLGVALSLLWIMFVLYGLGGLILRISWAQMMAFKLDIHYIRLYMFLISCTFAFLLRLFVLLV